MQIILLKVKSNAFMFTIDDYSKQNDQKFTQKVVPYSELKRIWKDVKWPNNF